MQNLRYYKEGDELYTDMLKAINNAKSSIDIECYIFANDTLGNVFFDLLKTKAQQNIVIRLLLDSVGSNRFRNYASFKKLTKSGLQIKWFNFWNWKYPFRFNKRNHRKLLLVDNDLCFMGGFNIHNESSHKYYGKNRWKDSHILFSGNLVLQLSHQFDLMWRGKGKKLKVINSLDKLTTIIPNTSRACRKHLRCKYLHSIKNAIESIKVITPYFVPDSKIIKALVKSAKSNTTVSLLVPKNSDSKILKFASYWYYKKLIVAGVRIFEYKSRMLHSKNILFDDKLAVIGSANLDYRSFFINNEIMLFSKKNTLIDSMKIDYQECLNNAQQITLETIQQRSLLSKLGSHIAYRFRKWL